MCVHLTRILLPAQLCFFASGVFAAFLLVRKHFSIQALTPVVYNIGTILGGVFLAREIGVSSLAIGTVAGALCGPLLLNAIGAYRAGMRYQPALDWSNPGLHEWVRMSIPLMLGVSLVSADNWIINYFASHVGGAITLLTYAKQIFSAPVALGQAAGAAGLPFLAGLFSKPDRKLFTRAVNSSVSRILAFSFLLSAFMIPMGFPLVDVLFRGGQFHRADTETMGMYFAIFSVALCLWSAKAIYARAFYAAGNTLTPMFAGTIVTAVSIPVYWALSRGMGSVGLAVASDIGILLQTSVLALLLHRRRLVSLAGLEYPELARSLVAALVSFAVLAALLSRIHTTNRLHEMALLAGATVIWLVTAMLTLRSTGSSLPSQPMEGLGLRAWSGTRATI